MKNKISKLIIVFVFLLPNFLVAQSFSLSNNSTIVVSGTSSLHDWDVIAEQFTGKIVFEDLQKGILKSMTIDVMAESLKSGKKGMDNNTYKALKTNNYKQISYELLSVVNLEKINSTTYKVNCNGNLTIAGITKPIMIDFLLTVENNSCTIVGSCSSKMTSFGIKPPKALLGTIKTGDDVTIKFNTSLVPE